jgi:hypothetical protein
VKSAAMSRSKSETIRRLRQGDLVRLYRHRYGVTLPNDDAGRDDLSDLLCVTSLAPTEPAKKMANVVEINAPWMTDAEAEATIALVNRMPIPERWRITKELGARHRLTNEQRERWKLWSLTPCDISKKDLAEQRKAKERARKRRQRLQQGRQSRAEYLATVKVSTKPWEAEGVSRRTWFYRKKKAALGASEQQTVHCTGCVRDKELLAPQQPSATTTQPHRRRAAQKEPDLPPA